MSDVLLDAEYVHTHYFLHMCVRIFSLVVILCLEWFLSKFCTFFDFVLKMLRTFALQCYDTSIQ